MLSIIAIQRVPDSPNTWRVFSTLFGIAFFLFPSLLYLVSSWQLLTPPEELNSELLDNQNLSLTRSALTPFQKVCGIIKAGGGVALFLIFAALLAEQPLNLSSPEDIFFFIAFTSIVLLFVVVQLSYVYRSWRTIARHARR